jgi:hypothetical protein
MGYALNQLNISNVLAENAIRLFAVGQKAWLFADKSKGTNASGTYYWLTTTAKANNFEPCASMLPIFNHIGGADIPEKIPALST